MPHGLSALVFDAYGTIFDVHSVAALAERCFPGQGRALSAAWRTKQLEYTWLRSLMGRYEDFSTATGDALDWALESLGLAADAVARRDLLAEYRRLALFPDAGPALEALAQSHTLAILSNGHPEMLLAVVDHNGLGHRFAGGVLSVHEAGVYKPHPAVYRLAEQHLDTPRDRIGFVSSNGWDAAGAKAFGFRVFWVNRAGAPVERLGAEPDVVIRDLGELVLEV